MGMMRVPQPALVSGWVRSRPLDIESISDCACATRNATGESAEDHDGMIVPDVESIVHGQGHPQLQIGLQEAKVRRENTDHDEGTPVDADLGAEDGGVPAEMALPEAGREYDHLVVPGRLLIGLEWAAHGAIDTQHREEPG
jgi:hypothetical protein